MRYKNVLLVCLLFQIQPVLAASYQATVRWANRIDLGIPVSGVIHKVNVVPGQSVTSGEVLLELQEAPFRAGMSRANAALANSKSVLRESKRDYGQARELYERKVLSTVSLENAKMKYQRAKAAVQEKQAMLEVAKYEHDHSKLKAPFDAWVLSRSAEPGQTIVSTLKSEPVITLAEKGRYLARFWLSIEDHRKLVVGSETGVSVMGKQLPARIHALSLEPSDKQEYWVDVSFAWKGNALRQGERVEVVMD